MLRRLDTSREVVSEQAQAASSANGQRWMPTHCHSIDLSPQILSVADGAPDAAPAADDEDDDNSFYARDVERRRSTLLQLQEKARVELAHEEHRGALQAAQCVQRMLESPPRCTTRESAPCEEKENEAVVEGGAPATPCAPPRPSRNLSLRSTTSITSSALCPIRAFSSPKASLGFPSAPGGKGAAPEECTSPAGQKLSRHTSRIKSMTAAGARGDAATSQRVSGGGEIVVSWHSSKPRKAHNPSSARSAEGNEEKRQPGSHQELSRQALAPAEKQQAAALADHRQAPALSRAASLASTTSSDASSVSSSNSAARSFTSTVRCAAGKALLLARVHSGSTVSSACSSSSSSSGPSAEEEEGTARGGMGRRASLENLANVIKGKIDDNLLNQEKMR